METVVVYEEIVQMKQDRIIPIFRCQVIETIVSNYCSHWSSAGVTRIHPVQGAKTTEGMGV